MKVAKELYVTVNCEDEEFKKIWKWLVKNTGPIEFRNVSDSGCFIAFKHGEDATAFKLIWGKQCIG